MVAARGVFLRYGFNRVSMSDIAEAAGVSRPALYGFFKNKEQIFIGVFEQWADETLAEIEAGMTACATPRQKLEFAFEIWAVRPFGMVIESPEAKALIECGFDFAQDSLRQGYARFESAIVPILLTLVETPAKKQRPVPERIAHLLASAVRGFKQTANSPAELRLLIGELLDLTMGV